MRRHLPDLFCTAVVAFFFSLLLAATVSGWQRTGDKQLLLLAAQETLIITLLIFRRRPQAVSRQPGAWVVAFTGTAAPLLLRSGWPLPYLQMPGLVLQVAGVVISLFAVSSLGRSFGVVAANRGIRTGGLYRWVRHPIYAAYFLSYAGFLMGNLSVANVLLLSLWFGCQHRRALDEERVLLRDEVYAAYAVRVPARYLPGLF